MADQPIITPVLSDDSYVFSLNFYNNTPNQSLLEAMTTQYLKDESINPDDLRKVYSNIKTWTDLDRVYYIPVLAFLTRYALNEPNRSWMANI